MIFFVIPIYKTEKYLKRCIDSVLNQTYQEVKIVLVDDGSPDNCPKVCDEYAREYDNIVVIHKKNGGLSDARNSGILYAMENGDKDDFITFLDSDDFVWEDYCSRLISICESFGADCVQCDYEKGEANEFSLALRTITPTIFSKSPENMLLDQRLKSQSWAKMYKLSCLEGISFPIGVLNEDEFTTYKIVYNSSSVAVTNEKLYYYYQHGESIMNDIKRGLKNNHHLFNWLDAYKERIDFFEKQGKAEQVLRTYEKICTDVILRYTEQMFLPKKYRDNALTSGEYLRIYRKSFPHAIKRKGISYKRKLMYIIFYFIPQSSVLPGKIFGLRK